MIEISANKGEGVEQAEARSAIAGFIRADSVLLVVCEASPAPFALAEWARAHRYELVELQESAPPDVEDEPFPEQYGVQRAVCALHAHVWPGLRRLDRLRSSAPSAAAAYSSESDEELQLEKAEEFAELLGRLDAARGSVADASDDERRAHAERLVGAFCRALGFDPDTL
ncbi:hypothetical protein EVAR_19638_1 [Eumeta japonica]|uniref:Alpha-and gamma-adaptin-binding protein p34 n=1 Tax=Eumeta variegata TaxID=151549 RepID=A0A4C1UFF3_EUMVA|nr:hypothetical protein EVAR_19638_1 [Eumeta japonica]